MPPRYEAMAEISGSSDGTSRFRAHDTVSNSQKVIRVRGTEILEEISG